ncbi:MAG: N-acetyl-gamma-glutamyl-phosphate reductase [Flavisolibacter sp.]
MNTPRTNKKKTALDSRPVRAGIIGGAGYTGGEVLRLLLNHPFARVQFIFSRTQAGRPVSSVHQDLMGSTDLSFTGDLSFLADGTVDVLFLCVAHGDARKFLQDHLLSDELKIIDLSQDFRLNENSFLKKRNFVYGLPELNKTSIRAAQNIANPGCFATAILLGLLPLAQAGLLSDIHTTGITGSTGAGQTLTPTTHFSWRANNIQPYKTLSHQHLPEILQSLHQLQSGFPQEGQQDLNFVPWRGDFTRGIFVSSILACKESLNDCQALYKTYYAQHPFVVVSNEAIFLKQVVNTNKCILQLEKKGNKLVVHSALDNLLKGASGQAVQNMNLVFDLEEVAGLTLKSTAF